MANSFIVAFTVAPLVTLPIALVFGWSDLVGVRDLVGPSLGAASLLAAFLAPLLLFSVLVSNLAMGLDRVRLYNELTIAYSLMSLVTALALMPFANVVLFLLGAAISVALPTIWGVQRILGGELIRPRFDAELFRSGFAFATKVYVATMFSFVLARVGAFALHHQSSVEEVGQFSVAVQFADGLTMLPSTIGVLLFPRLMRTKSDQRWSTLWRTFWSVAAIMTLLLGCVAILAPWIVPLLFGHSFARAAVVTQALMPSVLVASLLTIVSQYLAAEGFPRMQVFAWLIGVLVQIGSSYWLAGRWGGVGVALSLAASYMIVLALLLYVVLSRKNSETA